MLTRRGPAAPLPAGEWTRARLLATVGLLAALAGSLLAGVALWAWFRLQPAPGGQPLGQGGSAATAAPAGVPLTEGARQARRDALAAAPLATADLAAAKPAPLSVRDPGVIVLPPPTGAGPAGVPAGFPPTVEGAVAQLAAIDVDVLNTGSLDHARQVIGQWAQPGGPTGQTWSTVRALAGFYSTAGLAAGGSDSGGVLRVTPMMGLVKATDGPDWAVVCVDFQVEATIRQTARVAAADCQRMTWTGQRWVIAAGAEPAPGPSIWPGTDPAIAAGYRNLRAGS